MDNKKYHLDINLRPKGEEPIFTTEHKTLRRKIADRLFGQKQQYLIIVPSKAIDSISFTEVQSEANV